MHSLKTLSTSLDLCNDLGIDTSKAVTIYLDKDQTRILFYGIEAPDIIKQWFYERVGTCDYYKHPNGNLILIF